MCNRVVQNDLIIKPGGKMTVLMKGPGGEFELPFNEAIFGGPAKKESRNYWIQREGAEMSSCGKMRLYGRNSFRVNENRRYIPRASRSIRSFHCGQASVHARASWRRQFDKPDAKHSVTTDSSQITVADSANRKAEF